TETGNVGMVNLRMAADIVSGFSNPGIILSEGFTFEPGVWPAFIPLVEDGSDVFASVDFPAESVFTIGELPVLHTAEAAGVPMRIYPNPAEGFVHIELQGGSRRVWHWRLVNVLGQTIHTGTFTGHQHTIPLTGIAAGTYHLTMQSGREAIGQRLMVR
ncbi:MAG: T9SS type A sorting domain-containing protein, partial [Bacteroidota bacterium]